MQWIDGVPYKFKAPFDFSFLNKYGKVFKVFDNQGSGNICFGIQKDNRKYFIKFAGAPTENYTGNVKDTVGRLKYAVPAYQDLAHRNLINLPIEKHHKIIDFYSKIDDAYEGMSGIWNTDCEWYPPEQHINGAKIDEVSCVYMMGATAFALFGDGRDRRMEKWKLNEALFDVAKRAVSEERGERQQTIEEFIAEWRAAKSE